MSFDPEQVRAAWREYRRSKGDPGQPAEPRPARRLQINHRLSDSGEVHPSPRLLPVRAPVELVSSRASLDFSPQSTRAAALEELARTREVADREAAGRPGAATDLPPQGAAAGPEEAPRTLGQLAGEDPYMVPLQEAGEAPSWTSGWSADSAGAPPARWEAPPIPEAEGPAPARPGAGEEGEGEGELGGEAGIGGERGRGRPEGRTEGRRPRRSLYA